MITFKRSCGFPDESLSGLKCNDGYSSPIAYKGKPYHFVITCKPWDSLDCEQGCNSDGCNNNNDVETGFIRFDEDGITPRELECFEYASLHDYSSEDDFDQYGELANIDKYTRKCPSFANNGCFIGK